MSRERRIRIVVGTCGVISIGFDKLNLDLNKYLGYLCVYGGSAIIIAMIIWELWDIYKKRKVIKSQPVVDVEAKISLKEAAIRSCEQLRNDQNWMTFDRMLPTSQRKLGYFASKIVLYGRMNIYGERPPSRILERISFREHDINSYNLNDDLNAFYYRGEGNKEPQWQNLQVKEVDFNQFIENVKKERNLN